MKAFLGYVLLAIIAIALGIIGGIGLAQHQLTAVQERFYAGQGDQSIREPMRPILVVPGGLEIDFGTVVAGETYRHEFIFENRGEAPLEIQLVEKAEGVSVDIGDAKQTIAPSASLPIEMAWTPADDQKKTAYVEFTTNDAATDHERVRLVVNGK